MVLEIKLDAEKEVVVVKAQTVATDCILVNQVTDNGSSVHAIVTPVPKGAKALNPMGTQTINLILWAGEEYKKLGQWTDSDVEKRLIELL